MFAVTMIFLLILTVFTLFSGLIISASPVFAIFGVTYESPWSLFWYILLSFGLGALFEIPEKF